MRRCYLLSLLTLAACSSATSPTAPADAGASADAATGDFMTWTQNGQTYHATDVAAYRYPQLKITAFNGAVRHEGVSSSERTVTLSLPTTLLKAGTYSLTKSTGPDATGIPSGQLLLAVPDALPRGYSTLAGPAAANGTLTLTECDLQAQHVAGTFSFTAKAFEGTGNQVITTGSFRFARLQVPPAGM